MYESTGKVVEIFKTQTFASGFSKRDIVIDIAQPGSKYPSPVLFSFKKDHISELDGIKVGMNVVVKFAIDGRKWDGPKGVKYFNDLTGLKIAAEGATDVPQPAQPPQEMDDEDPDAQMPF